MCALIVVFEYGGLKNMGAPGKLYGMEYDVVNAFKIATEVLNIKPENVRIVTDVKTVRWDHLPLKQRPNVDILDIPKASWVIKRMFETQQVPGDIFFYYSGHGGNIEDPKNADLKTSFLVLTDDSGNNRRYVPQQEVAAIISKTNRPNSEGYAKVSVITRRIFSSFFSNSYEYSNHTERIYAPTVKGETNNALLMFDACQAGSLSGLRYRYAPELGKNSFVAEEGADVTINAVGFAATTIEQYAPSCSDGSPFTIHVLRILRKIKDKVTIEDLHPKFYTNMSAILKRMCSPVITASKPSVRMIIPMFNA